MTVTNNSLNAGFELDEIDTNPGQELDEALFQDVTPGVVPELKENVEVVQLNNRLSDLNYLEQDIKRARGMKRSFAMEAQVLIPDFINDKRPLEFFTELPTRTQLTSSLEAIQLEKISIEIKIETMKKAT